MSERRRRSEKALVPYVVVGESAIHGKGLFAKRDFHRGDYIGTFHGPLTRRNGTHVLWAYLDGVGGEAVGRRGANQLRYINHARRYNAEFDGFDLFASRRIRPGDEITIHYGEAYADES